jgi:hypothetical protein
MTGGGHDGCSACVALARASHREKKLLSWENMLLDVAARRKSNVKMFLLMLLLSG